MNQYFSRYWVQDNKGQWSTIHRLIVPNYWIKSVSRPQNREGTPRGIKQIPQIYETKLRVKGHQDG